MDRNELIRQKLIPLSKYWSMRLGFLDIINNTKYFIPLIDGRDDIGDDLKAMIRISHEWNEKKEINVGEGGALLRLLQFASWKFGLNKTFVREKTLKDREICNNPDIVNWKLPELLKLDNCTPQWASAAILTGNNEEIPDDYFLKMSKEALAHYSKIKETGGFCEVRYDETIMKQAIAFIELLKNGKMDFLPAQQDDYCFARAFNLIDREEGERRWHELKGHESNRLDEMEKQLENIENEYKIDSHDHRVIQAIAMLAFSCDEKISFAHPECVSKSWPQFWKFMDFVSANFGKL